MGLMGAIEVVTEQIDRTFDFEVCCNGGTGLTLKRILLQLKCIVEYLRLTTFRWDDVEPKRFLREMTSLKYRWKHSNFKCIAYLRCVVLQGTVSPRILRNR